MERTRRERFATATPPTTWQLPVAVTCTGLVLVVLTPLVMQSLVALLTSGQLAWPTGHHWAAYRALLQGHFGAGLPENIAQALWPTPAMWAWTLLGELVVGAAAVVVGLWMRDVTGTTSGHGLATSAQAAEALGLPRLRKNAAVIRPDLYGTGSKTPGAKDPRAHMREKVEAR